MTHPDVQFRQELEKAAEHFCRQELSQAQSICRQILARKPDHPQALHLLGLVAADLGQPQAALDLLRQAIAADPQAAECYFDLGQVLWAAGRKDDAIAAIRQGLALQPDNADAHNSLGIKLAAMGQNDRALAAFRQALTIHPDHPLANNNLGNLLSAMGQTEQAIDCYRRAVAAMPDFALAYNNLGLALRVCGMYEQAAASLQRAVELQPGYAEAWNNLANVYRDQGHLEQAINACQRARSLKTDEPCFHDNLLLTMLYLPDCDQQTIFQEHRLWDQHHAKPLSRFIEPHNNAPDPDRPLRIGYVSADFRDHPVARFLLPLLQNHDRQRFRVHCYSNSALEDSVTESIRLAVDVWRPIVTLDDQAAARLVREDGIDILVDLSGHTAGNRLLVFARKPAPVQISWLGYPDTTGLEAIDYRITDELADPPGMTQQYHTEQLIRLPRTAWCFSPPDDAVKAERTPDDRPMTFGCFNNLAKVTDPMLRLWARILSEVEGSRLFLKAAGLNSPVAQRRIEQIMSAAGIGRDRLILRGHERSYQSHLALYGQVDVALDTFPYTGTTTTCEALWMGVPVVTLVGSTHRSRVSLSLLSSIGLAQLSARSEDEYVSIAVELARDRAGLAKLAASLRRMMPHSPLMDGRAFAAAMEQAYRSVWRHWCEQKIRR